MNILTKNRPRRKGGTMSELCCRLRFQPIAKLDKTRNAVDAIEVIERHPKPLIECWLRMTTFAMDDAEVKRTGHLGVQRETPQIFPALGAQFAEFAHRFIQLHKLMGRKVTLRTTARACLLGHRPTSS